MATMVFQYCVLVFLLGLSATYAGYCGQNHPNCCLQKGIDHRSCNGSGTSDVSDLFGLMYKGKRTACVAGKPFGIYRIWDAFIQLQRGIQNLVNLYGLLGYVFQVPRSCGCNKTEVDHYLLQLGVCAELIKITYESNENVAGSNLPRNKLLRIIKFNNNKYFSAPCQVLLGTSPQCFSNIDDGPNARITNFYDGLSALRHVNFENGRAVYTDTLLPKIIQEYDLYVEADTRNGMYYQSGYPRGRQYECVDPNPNFAVGAGLVELGYDFSNANRDGKLCLMSQKVAQYLAPFAVAQLFFDILIFSADPYDSITIIYTLASAALEEPTLRALFSAAC